MTESPNELAQLEALTELDSVLQAHGIQYWLFGGWAVDFHIGSVTRPHADIDLAVWFEDRTRFAVLLLERRWTHRPELGADGYTCYERHDVQLEVAYLVRDEFGVVYTPLRDGRAEWPSNSVGEDVGMLRGVRARVMSRASLVAEKSVVRSDAMTAAKDRADVASLLRHS